MKATPLLIALFLCGLTACQTTPPTTQPSPSSSPTPSASPLPSATPSPTPQPTASVQPSPSPEPSIAASSPTPSPEPTPSATPLPEPTPSANTPLSFARIKVIAGNGESGTSENGDRVEEMALPSRIPALSSDAEGNLWMLNANSGILGYVTRLLIRPSSQGDIEYRVYRENSRDLDNASSMTYDAATKVFYINLQNAHQVIRFDPATGESTPVAGTGQQGYNGDGEALLSRLNSPTDVALDGAGNLYITDTGNHLIRKVTPDGRMITIAGQYLIDSEKDEEDDVPSYLPLGATSGDGGPAREARLESPTYIVARADGTLYFSSAAQTIRRIANDRIERYAGSGNRGYTGGRFLRADLANLNTPSDLAIGPDGLLYFIDQANNRIRRVLAQADGQYLEDVAGNGQTRNLVESLLDPLAAQMSPLSLAFDPAGNLYVYDAAHRRVRMLERQNTQDDGE
ncbi:MAG: hypothetical protein ACO1RX_15770 [Candidatus Sericytochromatia bacterium]